MMCVLLFGLGPLILGGMINHLILYEVVYHEFIPGILVG